MIKWRVTCADEAGLFNGDAIHFFGDGEDGVAHCFDPKGHVVCNGDIRSITQCVPKVFGCGIAILMLLQVIADSLI